MEQTLNAFSAEYRESLIAKCNTQYKNDLEDCETTLEEAMCRAELKANLSKIENNIDPFKTERPDSSDFECVGCGS